MISVIRSAMLIAEASLCTRPLHSFWKGVVTRARPRMCLSTAVPSRRPSIAACSAIVTPVIEALNARVLLARPRRGRRHARRLADLTLISQTAGLPLEQYLRVRRPPSCAARARASRLPARPAAARVASDKYVDWLVVLTGGR